MNFQRVQVNGYLVWLSFFYVAYLVLKAGFPSSESMYSLMGSLMLFVGGLAGIQASASFGGRRSFTGKIALYFALALILVSISMLASSLSAGLSYPAGRVLSSIDLTTFVLAQCISIYAIVASLRSVIDRINTRAVVYILLSALFSIIIALFNLRAGLRIGLIQSNLDEVFWVGLFPILIFLQLAGGLLLINLLGKWYATQTIRIIAFGFVCFDILFPPVVVYILVGSLAFLGYQATAFLTGISFQAVTAMFIVGLALTQMKPRQTGPFYAIRGAGRS
jgi:hypothetical protein